MKFGVWKDGARQAICRTTETNNCQAVKCMSNICVCSAFKQSYYIHARWVYGGCFSDTVIPDSILHRETVEIHPLTA